MTYRVALAGCGGIAGQHLDALKLMNESNGKVEAVAAADLDISRAQAASERYGSPLKAYADYKAMIDTERPDIVIITLPHFLHADAACYAAKAGCHVLLEKPMALDSEECLRIIEQARQSGVQIMVGHTQRYLAHNLHARRLIQEGSLGQLIMVHDVRNTDYFADWRPDWFLTRSMSGGGIAFNLGSHSVDKLVWLAGSPVASVTADMTYFGNRGDVEGSFTAYLRLENGVTATIVQSGYKVENANYTELLFTGGSLRLETGRALYRSYGGSCELLETPVEAATFVLQLEDLLSAIETNSPLSCTMEEAKHIVEVLEGMYRSHRSGREEFIGGTGLHGSAARAEASATIPSVSRSAEGAGLDAGDGAGPDAGNGVGADAGNGAGADAGNGAGADAGNGVGADAGNCAELAIRQYHWLPDRYAPKARAYVSYTEEELLISMRAYERDPLVRYKNHNDPVYKDSCLEFFLQPTPESDDRYLNLEVNAAGTILVGLGKGRQDRVYLGADEVPPLHIYAETNLRDQVTGEWYWKLDLRVPMSWLAALFPDFRPVAGTKMRGNFYKCGNETAHPHYGSWAYVRSEAPDFHRSQDFGWLILN